MRTWIVGISAAIGGFGMNMAIQKGLLDWFPNWLVYCALAAPPSAWIFLGLTHDNFRNYVKRTNRRMALTTFVIIGALIGGMIGWGIYALQVRSARIAALVTHIETANAFDIMADLRNADPLEKEAKARRYVGGTIDWNVAFFEVREIRGDSENFEAVFCPTIDRPPTHPFIVCVLPKKTHGYLANIKHQLNASLPVFHIKGLLTDINYETEFGPIKVGPPTPFVGQAPGEYTTALTNDQLAAKAEREKHATSPPATPIPTPVAPPIIEHKKSLVVVPPPTPTSSPQTARNEKERAIRDAVEHYRSTSPELSKDKIREAYKTYCDKIVAQVLARESPLEVEGLTRRITARIVPKNPPLMGGMTAVREYPGAAWAEIYIEVRFEALHAGQIAHVSSVLIGRTPEGKEIVAEYTDESKWSILSNGEKPETHEKLMIDKVHAEFDRLTDKITQEIRRLE
jgi:hypothetical protein